MELLLDNGMSVNLTNTNDIISLPVSAGCENVVATNAFVERGATLNNAKKYGVTPLMVAA
jgi:ankyrin repeat protein